MKKKNKNWPCTKIFLFRNPITAAVLYKIYNFMVEEHIVRVYIGRCNLLQFTRRAHLILYIYPFETSSGSAENRRQRTRNYDIIVQRAVFTIPRIIFHTDVVYFGKGWTGSFPPRHRFLTDRSPRIIISSCFVVRSRTRWKHSL